VAPPHPPEQPANFRRRYRATGKRQVGREVSIDDSRAVGDTKAKLVSVDDSPSRQARRKEKTKAVAAGLERLPGRFRRVIVWRHFNRHSFEEIGHRLGSWADAARMIWARGLKRLHQEIAGSGVSDSWGTRP
jgi:RNA polymerase sigma factor (sigma-70 family)